MTYYVFRFDSMKEGYYLRWDSAQNLNVQEVLLHEAIRSTNKYYFLDCIRNENIKAIPLEVAEAIDS